MIKADIDMDIFVEADRELLTLVWNNLFSNAIKFTEPGGEIAVSLKVNREYAVVQIKDTGCGIREEEMKHIFEKFYQADTSRAMQGNGLGLALAKRVIEIMGGRITVESEPGKGSVFTVLLSRKINISETYL